MSITRIAQPGRLKLGQPWVREIVPGVFRVGTTFLGCYAVEDAGAYIFIDVGLPGYWPQMTRFLAARNAPLSSVKAVVLTHYHPDHMGNAERLRTQAGAAVLVHHDDLAAATRKGRPSLYPLWKPPVLHLVGHFLRNGVARTAPVRTLGCAATRRSPALTGLRVDGSWVSPSPGTSSDAPGRGAGPEPGNLARSESASGTWWRGIRRLTALPGWERGQVATSGTPDH